MKRPLHGLFHVTFWLWNLLFLAVVYLGLLPFIGPPLFAATFDGQVPLEFSLTLVALVAIPTVCTAIGAFVGFLRKQPVQLMRLFYGVEAPLMVLCLIRLFLLRELTPGSTQILVSIGICVAAFLIEILDGYAAQHVAKAWLQLFAHSLMLLTGIYTGVILLFYAVPLASWLFQGFIRFNWLRDLWSTIMVDGYVGLLSMVFWVILSALLFFLSCLLFVTMPSMMVTLYTHSGLKVIRQFAAQYGQKKALAGVAGVTVASLVMFIGFQQQPQAKALELVQRPVKTDRDRIALINQSDKIRDGLLNAYLAQYRYLTSDGENDHIQRMYETVLGLPEGVAKGIQETYNSLMSPFIYHGSFAEVDKADKLYEQFFDTPIQKAERDPVNRALKSTWNRDEAKAGLLNFNQQKVWLKSQTMTVKEQDNWADIELYEVYKNETPDQQEVFYSFSLPESAVITGLWLGDTGDRAKRFPFVVSPRGAAQQVYTEQVQERVDPALLEQVGPRHYRLRAFPIPPKITINDRAFDGRNVRNRPTEMHLWLTYKVMQQPEGWAMPQLGEKRNLFWTNYSDRIRNGKTVKNLDVWVEDFLPASKPYQPKLQQAKLSEGYEISARPLAESDYALPNNQRFAIVLDSSRSMGKHGKELSQTFQWLKENGFANAQLTDNDADLYITASAGSFAKREDDIQSFDPNKQVFYGTVQLNDMLKQFTQLRGDTQYAGILLVTDDGSYELAKDKQTVPKLPAPLWMVHLGALPPAYDDAVLKAIDESSGGVGTDLAEVLRRQATKAALGATTVSVTDGYAWKMKAPPAAPEGSATANPSAAAKPTAFDPLAARQLILGLSRQKDMGRMANLDAIHAIAQRFQITTPYSSMLVLVNDQQRERLKQLEKQSDRFDREVESGKEQLNKPFSPMNSAVPEPSTWVGVAVVVIGFLAFKFKSRHKLKV
jgi:putative PEP-CTERM system integral membrane protein